MLHAALLLAPTYVDKRDISRPLYACDVLRRATNISIRESRLPATLMPQTSRTQYTTIDITHSGIARGPVRYRDVMGLAFTSIAMTKAD